MSSQQASGDDRASRLLAWFQDQVPDGQEFVECSLESAASGWSNETLVVDLRRAKDDETRRERFVVRAAPEGRIGMFPTYDLELQFRVVAALRGTGVVVPETYGYESDPSILGGPFFAMEWIEGEIASDFPPGIHGHGLFFDASPQRRARLWHKTIEAMTAVHAVDWRDCGLDILGNPASTTQSLVDQAERWEALYRWAAPEPVPLLDTAFDWVRRNPVQPTRLGLCWGDARPGNLIFRDDEVVAVLDWEMSHIGPPEADLAFLIFADIALADLYDVERLPGLPDEAATIEHFEQLTGRPIENWAFHTLFQVLKLAVLGELASRALGAMGLGEINVDTSSNWPTRKLEQLLGTAT